MGPIIQLAGIVQYPWNTIVRGYLNDRTLEQGGAEYTTLVLSKREGRNEPLYLP